MPRIVHAIERALACAILVLSTHTSARAQDLYHPIPWESASSVTCTQAATTRTRAELDDALLAARRGERRASAAELFARCTVPRREIAQAFNEGGLVRHRATDYAASAALFTEALAADPSFLPARFNLACAHARLGHGDAAVTELGEIARAGDDARPWLSRVRTDADLAAIRDREEVADLLAGRWTNYQRPAMPSTEIAPPSANGPVWEPIRVSDWAPYRALVIASGRYGRRQGIQPSSSETLSHPELAALERFDAPAWWRPEPGVAFLVIPFAIPGPNRREGMLILSWTGTGYTAACHEYCRELGAPQYREARFRSDPRPDELRVLRCRGPGGRCTTFRIHARGRSVYHRPESLIDGVTP